LYTKGVDDTQQNDLRGFMYIRNTIFHTGVTPSLREICRAVGFSSPRSAQLLLTRLERRGLLSYSNGVIRLSPLHAGAAVERTIQVPLIGSVACGLPSLAEQNYEAMIEVSSRIATPGHEYFVLRASGTSMNKSGIDDGALVLIRRQATANEGEKVVALVNDEATIKHFHRERDLVVLRPHSTDTKHRPIVLTDDFFIQGVVVATLPANII
jgi:repressor LexA